MTSDEKPIFHTEFNGTLPIEKTPQWVHLNMHLAKRLHVHFTQHEYYSLQSCLYDALSNAIFHGKNPLRIELSISKHKMVLSVADSGHGFDYQSRLRTMPHAHCEHHRVLLLMQHLGYTLTFNTTGNIITLTYTRIP